MQRLVCCTHFCIRLVLEYNEFHTVLLPLLFTLQGHGYFAMAIGYYIAQAGFIFINLSINRYECNANIFGRSFCFNHSMSLHRLNIEICANILIAMVPSQMGILLILGSRFDSVPFFHFHKTHLNGVLRFSMACLKLSAQVNREREISKLKY